MISIQHEDKLTVVGVFAEFELADYRRFEDDVVGQLERQGKLSLLIDLRDMLGYTVDVALEDIKFTRKHAHDVGRIAILSEREWIKWTALVSQLFIDAQIKIFEEEAAAREWLAAE
jgi:hypothetical protein